MTNIAVAEKAKVSSVGYVVQCALVNRLPQKLNSAPSRGTSLLDSHDYILNFRSGRKQLYIRTQGKKTNWFTERPIKDFKIQRRDGNENVA